MDNVIDSRLFAALQKLKGVVKLTQDAEGKLKYVKENADKIIDTQQKIRESFPLHSRANVSAPAQRKLCHLQLVK
jgi:hypothetical protein